MGERKSRVGKSEEQRRKRKGGVKQEGGAGRERREQKQVRTMRYGQVTPKQLSQGLLGGCQVPEHTPFQVLEGRGAQLSLC